MPVLNAVDLQCNEQSVLTAEVDAKEKARRYHDLKVVSVCLYAVTESGAGAPSS